MTLEQLQVIITAETSGLKKELNSLQAQLNTTQKNVNKSTSKMSSSFKKLTKAVSLTAIAVGLAKLSKAAISTASDLQEVQNVVDVAFGSMASEVEEFADTATEKFGLSALQAKEFASTFMAMSNGMGIAADTGKSMSLTLTQLAGDMASFYNVSQDMAATALNSVFTGETETLKKFGVVMTEANLSAYALSRGISKAYSEMSQAEKVILRYSFVLNSTKNAQGDYARTCMNWANQVKLLRNQFSDLLSVLGSAFMKALTPVIQLINLLLSKLLTLINTIAEAFGGTGIKEIKAATGGAASNTGDMASNIADSNKEAKKLQKTLAGFDQINTLDLSSGSSGSSGSGSGGGGGVDSDIAALAVETYTVEPDYSAYEKFEAYLGQIGAIFDSWYSTIPKLQINFDSQQALEDVKQIGLDVSNIIAGWSSFVITIAIEVANDLDIGQLGNDVLGLVSSFSGLVSSITSAVVPALESFYRVGLSPLVEAIGEVASAILQWTSGQLDDWAQWFDTNKEDINTFATNLGKVVEPLSTIVGELLKVAWDAMATALDLVNQALQKIAEAILKIPPEVIASIVASLGILAGIKIGETAFSGLKAFKDFLSTDLNTESIKTAISGIESYITNGDSTITNFVEGIGKKFASIPTTIGNAFKAIGGAIATPIGAAVAVVAALVAGFIYLWNTNEDFRESITKLYNESIKPVIEELGEKLDKLWNESLKPLWEETLKPLLEEIGGKVGELFGKLKELWDGTLEPVLALILTVVVKVLAEIFKVVGDVIGKVIDLIGAAIKVVKGIIDFLVGVFTGDWEKAWNGIKEIFSGFIEAWGVMWGSIKDKFSPIINWLKEKFDSFKEWASNAVSGIKEAFKNIPDWFKDKFSTAWQKVKDVFSKGGKVFSGIKDGILNGLKAVINALISGINTIIRIPFNGINAALRKIRDISFLGISPFKKLIGQISIPQIPKLAKGGVIDAPTVAMMGEYAGASSNPEIVAPQSILKETINASNETVVSTLLDCTMRLVKAMQDNNTTIEVDGDGLFNLVRNKANNYTYRTGKPAFI